MMMFSKTMVQRVSTYAKGQQNHPGFKSQVVNNVDTKQRQKETNKGSIAQWMAQATDVVIPNASQFIV
jgi:hypothetical protein